MHNYNNILNKKRKMLFLKHMFGKDVEISLQKAVIYCLCQDAKYFCVFVSPLYSMERTYYVKSDFNTLVLEYIFILVILQ